MGESEVLEPGGRASPSASGIRLVFVAQVADEHTLSVDDVSEELVDDFLGPVSYDLDPGFLVGDVDVTHILLGDACGLIATCKHDRPVIYILSGVRDDNGLTGGTGRGTIECLGNMELALTHMGMRAYDRIPVNRYNMPYMIPALEEAGATYVERLVNGFDMYY